jgi:multidrug efflux pump
MTRFNLSDWALNHRSLIWFLMIICLIAGAMSYVSIGREEDPNFSIKTMIITASLPGADTQETLTQVTDRIEKKLEDLAALDFTRSVTRPGGHRLCRAPALHKGSPVACDLADGPQYDGRYSP